MGLLSESPLVCVASIHGRMHMQGNRNRNNLIEFFYDLSWSIKGLDAYQVPTGTFSLALVLFHNIDYVCSVWSRAIPDVTLTTYR